MDSISKIDKDYSKNIDYMNQKVSFPSNFDVISREIKIGSKHAQYYYLDGFLKDDIMQKVLEYFLDLSGEMPQNIDDFAMQHLPYSEISMNDDWNQILYGFFSGNFVVFIEGYRKALLIDTRTYPARGVEEPDKDKVLRGSKDGFVETIIFNTALVRRRIRSEKLCMEMFQVGLQSKTDIVIAYLKDKVDKRLLKIMKDRIENIKADALPMSQESLAECLYQGSWMNPLPKFKYTERPDTASAQILEGNIIIFIDNSPLAMILQVTIFDIMEDTGDYCFPPFTGTYLRFTRLLIAVLSFVITPTFLLLMQHKGWIPQGFEFIIVKDTQNIPLILQFLLLELAIDGMRLAAVNTPNMLSTPLSILAALVLGDLSVSSGWFNAEVMLYMAFVAIANYTQPNYELGYAFKFFRIMTLILTELLSGVGYALGIFIVMILIIKNKTVSGKSYLYPLIPFNGKLLLKRLIRMKKQFNVE